MKHVSSLVFETFCCSCRYRCFKVIYKGEVIPTLIERTDFVLFFLFASFNFFKVILYLEGSG